MVCLILTTFGSEEDAANVTRILVEEKLAACGTLFPKARSIYPWKGAIEDTSECVVLLKTADASPLKERLRALHPYETPEIIVLDPADVSEPYARWVGESCSGTSHEETSRR